MSALAASMWNLGLDVRAGAPRRSQASSLRARFCRFASVGAGTRARPTRCRMQDVGGVAALERLHDPVVDLPGGGADLVEEPAIVGDDDEAARAGRPAPPEVARGPWE